MSQPPAGAPADGGADVAPTVPPDVAAEAAVWIARLHGPGRTPAMEREFQAWQARSPAHRLAFERCTDTWQAVSGINVAMAFDAAAAQRPAGHRAGPRLLAWGVAAALAAALVGGTLWFQQWREQGVYATGVGEQRLVMLDDGTRLLLNTDTRLRVAFSAGQRTVDVHAGEALFEVAKDARRPFVVRVAGSEVVAVGTAFAVRFIDGPQDGDALAVTLIEGQVNVRPAAGRSAGGLAPRQPVLMHAGERLQLDHRAGTSASTLVPSVDRPNIDQLIAWKRREAVFDGTPLVDAVEEMNRYSRTPVVLVGPVAERGLHVSGQFRTGDSAGFARAVAALHGLTLRDAQGRIELVEPQ